MYKSALCSAFGWANPDFVDPNPFVTELDRWIDQNYEQHVAEGHGPLSAHELSLWMMKVLSSASSSRSETRVARGVLALFGGDGAVAVDGMSAEISAWQRAATFAAAAADLAERFAMALEYRDEAPDALTPDQIARLQDLTFLDDDVDTKLSDIAGDQAARIADGDGPV